MSADRNLYSFNGPYNDGETLDLSKGPNGLGWAETEPWADTLKFSTQLQDFELTAGRVQGGLEDCADFNNGCSNIRLHAESFVSGGKYVATVKDSVGIDIRGRIDKGGSEVDIDYGNWSDQGSRKVTGCVLGVWKPDGSPVTVRCLNADRPMEVPNTGPYRYVFPVPGKWYHGIAVWVFLTSRRLKLWR